MTSAHGGKSLLILIHHFFEGDSSRQRIGRTLEDATSKWLDDPVSFSDYIDEISQQMII